MCGILGTILNHNTNLYEFIELLNKLQHRGYESFGVCYNNFKFIKQSGKVKNNINYKHINIKKCIGHTRYTTNGNTNNINECQPILGNNYALVHNGTIKFNNSTTNTNDTNQLINIINEKIIYYGNIIDALKWVINSINGVYSLLIMTSNGIYCVRDRYGVRPLYIAHTINGFQFSSEDYIFSYNSKNIYNCNQGEILFCDGNNIKSIYQRKEIIPKICSFEYIYFMNYKTTEVKKKRIELGKLLGNKEKCIVADYVVCIPNTSIPNAIGFSDITKVEFKKEWIIKDNKCDRSFILPNNLERIELLNKKFIFSNDLIGKKLYIIDDSIVRGNTMKEIIKKLRQIGVKEIHLRIASPIVQSPCNYGIDIPTKSELIGGRNTNICEELGADSLIYLEISELVSVIGTNSCTSCFDNKLLW